MTLRCSVCLDFKCDYTQHHFYPTSGAIHRGNAATLHMILAVLVSRKICRYLKSCRAPSSVLMGNPVRLHRVSVKCTLLLLIKLLFPNERHSFLLSKGCWQHNCFLKRKGIWGSILGGQMYVFNVV